MFKLQDRLGLLKTTTSNDAVKKLVSDAELKLKNSGITNRIGFKQFEGFVNHELVKDLKSLNEDDTATTAFIEREEKIFALDSLSVKKGLHKIREAEISKYPILKVILEKIKKFEHLEEYKIAESVIQQLLPFEWDDTIKDVITEISESVKSQKENINLQNAIDNILESKNNWILSSFDKELNEYFINRSETSRILLLEKLEKLKFNGNVITLIDTINEASKTFKIKNTKGNVKITDVYSPAIFNRHTTTFNVSGRYLQKFEDGAIKELTESEISTLPNWFTQASSFLNTPQVSTSFGYIKARVGDKTVEIFNEDENIKLKLNGKHVLREDFNKSFMMSGIFHKKEYNLISEVKNLIEHFNDIVHVDFVKRISDAKLAEKFVDVFSTDESLYINQVDKRLGINTFGAINAYSARENVLEFLNYDLGETFKEVLDESEQKITELQKIQLEIFEAIDIMKEKKNQVILMLEGSNNDETQIQLENLSELITEEIEKLQKNASVCSSKIQSIKEGDELDDEGDEEGDGEESDMLLDKDLHESKIKIQDKIVLADGRAGTITGIDDSERSFVILMDDGITIDVPMSRQSELSVVKTTTNGSLTDDPDGVQQLKDTEKTAIVENNANEFVDGKNLKTGENIKVNALEFTSMKSSELISIILNKKPEKLQKELIKIV